MSAIFSQLIKSIALYLVISFLISWNLFAQNIGNFYDNYLQQGNNINHNIRDHNYIALTSRNNKIYHSPTLLTQHSITDNDLSQYYKVTKIKTLLPCIYPNFINGMHTKYIRNSQNQIVYIITMEAVQGFCQWHMSQYLFNPNTPASIIRNIHNQNNNTLYLQETAYIKFNIKKLRNTQNLAINIITIPYFVLVNDKKNDTIISQKNYSITLKLPKSGNVSYVSNSININTAFLSKNYLNIEILSGLY